MIEIRTAQSEDVIGIEACIEVAYARYRDAGIALPPVSEGVAEDVRDNLVWVALEAGNVAGVLIAVASRDAWHLANLAVHPGYGGRGLGRALIERMEDAAKRAGVGDLALTTHVAMPDNVAIYTRLGWHETGREGDKIFMVRRLSGKEEE